MNRTQIVLLIAVLGMGTFYVWSKMHKLETEKKEYEAKRWFPEKKDEDFEAISVTCTDPAFAYVLRRVGDRWYLDGNLASHEKSPQLVMSLVELSTEREIKATPKPEDDKEFGLDTPTYTIAMTGNGGVDMGTVLLGDRTPGANHFYGRWKKGGPIETVPAYMLGTLEEEPKDLREMSPFPVEVPAVASFEFSAGDQKAKLVRPEGDDDAFVFEGTEKKPADESKVDELMYLLKDLKVGRFLAPEETTDLGPVVAGYRVHEADSKVDVVAEFCGPVGVNPKLRYGRRYLTEPGKSDPLEGTQERFVIEMLEDSEALHPTVADFEDKRIQKLNADKVKSLKLTLPAGGGPLAAERLPQGGWKITAPPERAEESEPGQRVDKLLWAIRDLRYSDDKAQVLPSGKDEWTATLEMEDGKSHDYRFGRDKSGKPFVGFGDRSWLLQHDSVPALDEAAAALAKEPGATATPTP